MAAKSTRNSDRPPSHPGALLKEIVLPESGLPVLQAAKRLGVTRQNLHRLLAGEISVSPGMALRLSRLFGGTPEFWLRMQQAHDLWHERRTLADELAAIEPVRRAAAGTAGADVAS